jgi:TolB-like protein/Tfp pilus assembly protein PilF
MSENPSFVSELKRRNVIRAAILYVGAVWALAQGISQLGPSLGAPEWATRWFLVAAGIGFPFWIGFAWFYEFTPEGLKRESEIDPAKSISYHTGRKLDFAIIGVLTVAVVLLLTDRFVFRHGVNETTSGPILEKSIAVLPFENLSSDKENAYFTDGVQDEILTHLAKVADLKVISRTSVMQYKTGVARNLRKVGEELGVAHVLEGSVQRAAKTIRVNVQLIDARNDRHEWAEDYDRNLADVFAIQSEIAQAIADQLQAKLSPAEKNAVKQRPTSDLTAFEQYSRAKTLMVTGTIGSVDERHLLEAIDLLNSAVTRDPSFHAAYASLVQAHDQIYTNYSDHTPARLALAEAALQKATKLRPDAPETHNVRGSHLYAAYRDYNGALREVEAARAGLPNSAGVYSMIGFIKRRQGEWEEGIRGLKKAIAVDPLSTYLISQLAWSYDGLRRYPEEKATLQRVLEITPDDVTAGATLAFVDLSWHADPAALHRFIDRLRAERPSSVPDVADSWFTCALAERDWPAAEEALTTLGNNSCWLDSGISFSRTFGEGLLARAMNDEIRARKAFTAARLKQEQVVQNQKNYGPPLCVLGLIDAALGNREAALQEGRRAMELLPIEKDLISGYQLRAYFAVIAAWAGAKDLALEQLRTAGPAFGANGIASYGVLKLLPFWDPLRGDPRFEQFVQSLAPK